MIGGCLRLIRTYPNVVVLFFGLWLAVAPFSFVYYVEDCVWATGLTPTGFDAVLCYMHNYRYGQTVGISVFFLGVGTSMTAIGFMLRPWVRPWLRPKR